MYDVNTEKMINDGIIESKIKTMGIMGRSKAAVKKMECKIEKGL